VTDELVPITEAADVLHVHRATLYREIGARRIRLTKIRGRSFILGSEIERYKQAMTKPGKAA